jgi:hypothetical protein
MWRLVKMNNAFEKLKMQMSLEAMKATKPEVMQFQIEMAGLMFNYFSALTKAGFKPWEALKIVIEHGAIPKTQDSGGQAND